MTVKSLLCKVSTLGDSALQKPQAMHDQDPCQCKDIKHRQSEQKFFKSIPQ